MTAEHKCEWYINPFASDPEDGSGQCEKPAQIAKFRRKEDGIGQRPSPKGEGFGHF